MGSAQLTSLNLWWLQLINIVKKKFALYATTLCEKFESELHSPVDIRSRHFGQQPQGSCPLRAGPRLSRDVPESNEVISVETCWELR
jgi:hypothetical protein